MSLSGLIRFSYCTALSLVGLLGLYPPGCAAEDTTLNELVELLADPNPRTRSLAVAKLRQAGKAVVPSLTKALGSADPETKRISVALLRQVTCPAWARVEADSHYSVKYMLPERVVCRRSGIRMVLIPPGAFSMGVTPGDRHGAAFEQRPRRVVIRRPFFLGIHEVTQAEWTHVMGKNPNVFVTAVANGELHGAGAQYPVNNVCWNTVQPFLRRTDLRLPTEAEWEYACRAGSSAVRYGALDKIACFRGMVPGPVAKKMPNAFGLYDMLGNVWELCADEWTGPLPAGFGKIGNANLRVMRGSGGKSNHAWLRASMRYPCWADSVRMPVPALGFRVAADP